MPSLLLLCLLVIFVLYNRQVYLRITHFSSFLIGWLWVVLKAGLSSSALQLSRSVGVWRKEEQKAIKGSSKHITASEKSYCRYY